MHKRTWAFFFFLFQRKIRLKSQGRKSGRPLFVERLKKRPAQSFFRSKNGIYFCCFSKTIEEELLELDPLRFARMNARAYFLLPPPKKLLILQQRRSLKRHTSNLFGSGCTTFYTLLKLIIVPINTFSSSNLFGANQYVPNQYLRNRRSLKRHTSNPFGSSCSTFYTFSGPFSSW